MASGAISQIHTSSSGHSNTKSSINNGQSWEQNLLKKHNNIFAAAAAVNAAAIRH